MESKKRKMSEVAADDGKAKEDDGKKKESVSSLTIKSVVTLNTGAKMPMFGFGTYELGEKLGPAVKTCLSLGVRKFDTAAFYKNEKELGIALRESKVPREELFVVTKLWYADHGYEQALKAFNDSFERLGLNYIDLYLIHWPGTKQDSVASNPEIRKESWRALEKIYSEGKARAIGVSNYTIKHLKELESAKIKPALNQCEFHPRLYQKELLEYCKKHNIVFEAYSSLAKGKLTDNEAVAAIGKKYKKTVSQVLLRWGLQHGVPVIPRSSNADRIKENSNIFDFEISEEEMATLDALNENLHTLWDPTEIP